MVLLLKISGGILVLLLVAGIFVTTIFGNNIKQIIVSEINKRLATEVHVSGAIDFSVYRNFPFASVTFNKVEIRESFKDSKRNLLKTERVDILFNLLDIWRKNYVIKKIIVGKGDLNVRIDENGQTNYAVFKSSSDSTEEFSIDIRSILFSDLNVEYDDKRHQHLYSFHAHQGNISGIFSSKEFTMELESALFCNSLKIGSYDYLNRKEVEISSRLLVNTEKNYYKIQNTKLSIDGVKFSVNGTVQERPKSILIDLTIAADKTGIESLSGVLPNEYGKRLKEYRLKGDISLSGTIHGDYSDKINPEINFRFSVKKGKISHERMSSSFENVNLTALYSNGAARNLKSSVIAFKDATASIMGKQVQVSFELKDFSNPYLNIKIGSVLNLKEIFPLLQLNDVNEMSGEIILTNIYYSGYAKALNSKTDLASTQAGGEIILRNVSISTDRSVLENVSGTFKLDRNSFIISNLAFKAGQSDIQISGTMENLIPYILAMKTKGESRIPIGIDVTVNSGELNWEELLKPQMNKETNTPPSPNMIPAVFDVLSGKITADIKKFSYDKFHGENIHGTVLFIGDDIYFNNVSLIAESGMVKANGKLDKSNKDAVKLESSFVFTNIDIRQLFYECNNWGQSEITDKNLRGIANSTFVLKAGWKKTEFDNNQLVVVGDISIDKGELINFAPMKALSAFVKISDLEQIKFSRLDNQIEIKNRTVNIPAMQIHTNVLNLEASGSHTFDNVIDYRIKLNLLQLLTNKFKSRHFDPETTEQTSDGLFNLYLTMKGDAANPVIQYDKRAVKEKIKQDIKTESKNLKQILKEEFNQQEQQQEKVKDWKAPAEYEYMQFDTTDDIRDK